MKPVEIAASRIEKSRKTNENQDRRHKKKDDFNQNQHKVNDCRNGVVFNCPIEEADSGCDANNAIKDRHPCYAILDAPSQTSQGPKNMQDCNCNSAITKVNAETTFV